MHIQPLIWDSGEVHWTSLKVNVSVAKKQGIGNVLMVVLVLVLVLSKKVGDRKCVGGSVGVSASVIHKIQDRKCVGGSGSVN
jgi:hypothetical protein